jgi:hydroxyacylglutathione hydrolase
MLVPGHTLGALAYHLPEVNAVFTGDTLFTAGCGRLFEGTPAQMYRSLSRLGELPGETQVYCGHEYTENNLRFAASVEGDNPRVAERLEEVVALRAAGRPTVPASMAVERSTNPFMRADEPALGALMGKTSPVETFGELRRRKDLF